MTKALQIAQDDKHGYSMVNRYGNPDYDCSSLVIACVDDVGIPVKSFGATYTGNMRTAFIKAGFVDVTNIVDFKTQRGLQRGDILLNEVHHTEIYLGNKSTVGAHSNYDGVSGDGSGREICVAPYHDYPWEVCLRYPVATADNLVFTLSELNTALLVLRGNYGDGEARRIRLQKEGFSPDKVQALVNVLYPVFDV